MKLSLALLFRCTIFGWLQLLGLGGCLRPGAFDGPSPPIRDPEYSFGFYNATSQTLRDVQITWSSGGFECIAAAGILTPDLDRGGGGKADAFQPDPIPARVTLSWRTPEGALHTKIMDVASRVRDLKRFTGTIYFKYMWAGEDGWAVVPMSKDERDHLAEQQKPIIPPDPPATPAPATQPATAPTTGPSAEEQVRNAIKMVHMLMLGGEAAPLDQYCVSDDPATAQFIQACSRLSVAAHGFADAIRGKLGQDAVATLNLNLPDPAVMLREEWVDMKASRDPFPPELEKATVEIVGDRATVRLGEDAVTARRIAGRWKLLLPNWRAIVGAGNIPGTDANSMIRACDMSSLIDEQLTDGVRRDKFKTADEVTQAREKLRDKARDQLNAPVPDRPAPQGS